MNRPKNEDIGKPSRRRRVPVMMTDDEYAKVEAAAGKVGSPVSTFIRIKILEAISDE